MNHARTGANNAALRHFSGGHASGAGIGHEAALRDQGASIGNVATERDFAVLRATYRASGGVALGDDLARLLEDHRCGDFVSLARLLVTGEIFGFEWRQSFWVPMFQFELRDLSTKRGPQQVVAELAATFAGWTLAVWFARPNCWLHDRRPVDVLDAELPAVLEAARTDRLVSAG